MIRLLRLIGDRGSASQASYSRQEDILGTLLQGKRKESIADLDPGLVQFVFGADQQAASDFMSCAGRYY